MAGKTVTIPLVRKNFFIPKVYAVALKIEAARTGESEAQVVRRALAAFFGRPH
jgi:hypothetical protein